MSVTSFSSSSSCFSFKPLFAILIQRPASLQSLYDQNLQLKVVWLLALGRARQRLISLGLSWTVWDFPGLSNTLWDCLLDSLGLSGTVWNSLWDSLGLFDTLCGTLWVSLGLSWIVLDCLGMSGTVLDLTGTIWGPTWTIRRTSETYWGMGMPTSRTFL